ncbi:stress-regulated transcription factor RPN4 NDAI_0A06440 [Naumovozyma dairenensis CBS 421]|uniref:C2H2-type domain-containing protein n=1 Tax=Naumovozyma dairenensis (strain ATCC 10597 / BCRC 20456 / CBS 421 / NBRC 0211 / NRRL Y-12639) TaxID=1071378 RepID=G0W4R0_NAUDC|nr:hypothetical protein NDAI_0A06440 [Naumovozyma dairenensis CBS 421]CCD22798.1 hypothetical protein NDAI_0A06440 [Naumovozyma dairenensis CBS 421]
MATTELYLKRTLTDVLEDELYHLTPTSNIYQTHPTHPCYLHSDPNHIPLHDRLSNNQLYLSSSSSSSSPQVSSSSSSSGLDQLNELNWDHDENFLNVSLQDLNIFNKYADPSLTTTTTPTSSSPSSNKVISFSCPNAIKDKFTNIDINKLKSIHLKRTKNQKRKALVSTMNGNGRVNHMKKINGIINKTNKNKISTNTLSPPLSTSTSTASIEPVINTINMESIEKIPMTSSTSSSSSLIPLNVMLYGNGTTTASSLTLPNMDLNDINSTIKAELIDEFPLDTQEAMNMENTPTSNNNMIISQDHGDNNNLFADSMDSKLEWLPQIQNNSLDAKSIIFDNEIKAQQQQQGTNNIDDLSDIEDNNDIFDNMEYPLTTTTTTTTAELTTRAPEINAGSFGNFNDFSSPSSLPNSPPSSSCSSPSSPSIVETILNGTQIQSQDILLEKVSQKASKTNLKLKMKSKTSKPRAKKCDNLSKDMCDKLKASIEHQLENKSITSLQEQSSSTRIIDADIGPTNTSNVTKNDDTNMNNTMGETYTCRIINLTTNEPCSAQFSRSYDLTRHQNTIHASKKTVFRCSECIKLLGSNGFEKTFSRLDALTRHIKSKHENLNTFERRQVTKFAKENIGYVLG